MVEHITKEQMLKSKEDNESTKFRLQANVYFIDYKLSYNDRWEFLRNVRSLIDRPTNLKTF